MKVFSRFVDLLIAVVISCFAMFLFLHEKEYLTEKDIVKTAKTPVAQPDVKVNLGDLSATIQQISDSKTPSILWINANDQENAFGTGFVIEWNKQLYILSNYHVVEQAERLTAFLPNNTEVKLRLVGYDASLDLAVLSFEEKAKIPPLTLGDATKMKVGDFVVAIGHPLGLDYTTTFGIISKLNRELQLGGNSFTNLIQTDAAINPGNSGGPLFNLKGEVIGINTAIMDDSQGLGFAISTADVVAVMDELIANGTVARPFLGVNIMDTEEGVEIIDILEDSPAEKAGLLPEDLLLSIDNQDIKTVDVLTETMKNYKTGTSIKVKIKRDGNIMVIETVVGDKNEY